MVSRGRCTLYRVPTSTDETPTPTGALGAYFGPHFAGCIAALAFIPHQAKIALERARASPAVEHSGAPVVEVPMLTGKRATHVADGQWLWSFELRHVSWTSIVITSGLRGVFSARCAKHELRHEYKTRFYDEKHIALSADKMPTQPVPFEKAG